jgi:hypothetical protein
MRELLTDQPLFVGFKADNRLRERLQSLDASDKVYVSTDGSTSLLICSVGDDLYVGKIMDKKLTTDQIDDIRNNVLSIMRKLGHEVHLPKNLVILACRPVSEPVNG